MPKYTKPARRYRKRRSWLKSKRYKKRRTSTRTGFLSVQQKVLDTSMELEAGAWPNGIVKTMDFKASQVAQFPTYAALFDQYRINAVKVTLLPTTNAPGSTNPAATFASSVDLDGGTVTTTFDQILQCSNARTSPWSSMGGLTPYKSIYLKPRTADALITAVNPAGQPTAFSVGLGNRSQWLDVADNGDTVHHGLHLGWYFGLATVSALQGLNVVITYYLQFRKVR